MDREITITVSEEEARLIDEQVSSGAYASAEELLHAGLMTVAASSLDDEVLRKLIAEADADPRPSVPLDVAFDQVFAYIDELERRMNEEA
jgi:antitoxin ParD1/3/4